MLLQVLSLAPLPRVALTIDSRFIVSFLTMDFLLNCIVLRPQETATVLSIY